MVLQPHTRRDGSGLGSSAFARHYLRNHCYFLFLRVLRCFSSPGSPPFGCHVFNVAGCPIRIPADRFVCADPRGFSQLVASFIASESLGIPHAPFSAFSPATPKGRRPASWPVPSLARLFKIFVFSLPSCQRTSPKVKSLEF